MDESKLDELERRLDEEAQFSDGPAAVCGEALAAIRGLRAENRCFRSKLAAVGAGFGKLAEILQDAPGGEKDA